MRDHVAVKRDTSASDDIGGRDLVLAHLRGLPVQRLPAMPITMMFAAKLAGIPYERYCRDHAALVLAQTLVAERFGFDHVSAISDPAREAADLGASLHWFADQPPALDHADALLADPARLAGLAMPDPLGGGRMTDRVRAVEGLRAGPGKRLLVEGWVEGPCAEGADLRGLSTLMLDFADRPDFVDHLFAFSVDVAVRFAQAQVDAGADVIGVGDAAASLVGPGIYRAFVLPHERRLVDAIHGMGALVRLHICGNTLRIVEPMASLGADIIDVDYPVDLGDARTAAGPAQVLLGNLNPVTALMQATADEVSRGIAACHQAAGSRWIVGAGCEIPPATPLANVDALTAYARSTAP